MAAVKVTMLFQLRTVVSSPNYPGGRIAGWSESFYFPGTDIQAALNALTKGQAVGNLQASALAPARAALLPTGAAIVGFRLQVVDPAGLAQSLPANYPGSANQGADIPQSALLLRTPGLGVRNIRRTTLRCIPDANVVEGEYQPQGQFSAALTTFIIALAGWQFRGRDLSQTANPVLTVTSGGLLTAVPNLAYSVGQMVRVLRTKDAAGNLRGGRFQVSALGTTANSVQLAGWNWGATTGGSVRLDQAAIYATIDTANTQVGRVVVRKVGRPFTAYRGRRSRKR